MSGRVRDILPPALIGLAVLVVWEVAVRVLAVPHYILPGPLLVGRSGRRVCRGRGLLRLSCGG